MIAVLWGLLAAVMVGTSDAIARKTSQHADVRVLPAVVMAVSTGVLSVWFLSTGDWPRWHAAAWIASAVSGTLNIAVLFFLYTALRRGPVSVASPAASTFTVMLVGMNAVTGEPWAYTQLIAVVIVFFGIFMLSRRTRAPGIDDHYTAAWIRQTALLGLTAAFAVAVRMYLAQDASDILGPSGALLLNRVFALIAGSVLVSVLWFKRTALTWPKGTILGYTVLQALLETGALGVFLIGSRADGRIGATIGFSAFAAVTAIVASFWFGERIGKARAGWITLVVIGLMLASAF